VVISDSIGSPGFARDHLGFRSHSIGSPGIPSDHLGISHSLGSPGYAGDHLGFPLASWLSLGLAVTLGFSRTTRFTPVVLWFSRSTALGHSLTPPPALTIDFSWIFLSDSVVEAWYHISLFFFV
jgi:hypothetical protein